MRLVQLEYFIKLAECGSITKAEMCIRDSLRTCGSFMHCRVCRIYKLSRDKAVRDLFGKFFCLCDCSGHSLCSFCQYQFCSVRFQDVSSFYAHRLRHGKDDAISFHLSLIHIWSASATLHHLPPHYKYPSPLPGSAPDFLSWTAASVSLP